MVGTLSPNRSDHAFHVRILPRAFVRGNDVVESEARESPEISIAVVEYEPRHFLKLKSISQLLRGPRRRGLCGHSHPQDFLAIVGKYDQNVKSL